MDWEKMLLPVASVLEELEAEQEESKLLRIDHVERGAKLLFVRHVNDESLESELQSVDNWLAQTHKHKSLLCESKKELKKAVRRTKLSVESRCEAVAHKWRTAARKEDELSEALAKKQRLEQALGSEETVETEETDAELQRELAALSSEMEWLFSELSNASGTGKAVDKERSQLLSAVKDMEEGDLCERSCAEAFSPAFVEAVLGDFGISHLSVSETGDQIAMCVRRVEHSFDVRVSMHKITTAKVTMDRSVIVPIDDLIAAAISQRPKSRRLSENAFDVLCADECTLDLFSLCRKLLVRVQQFSGRLLVYEQLDSRYTCVCDAQSDEMLVTLPLKKHIALDFLLTVPIATFSTANGTVTAKFCGFQNATGLNHAQMTRISEECEQMIAAQNTANSPTQLVAAIADFLESADFC